MIRVSTHEAFEDFRRQLLASERNPLVVASIAEWADEPDVDVDELAHELEGAAGLYVLVSEATFWLTDALGKPYSVHSGWVRVYPSNPEWQTVPAKAPLIRPVSDRRRMVRRVIDAALEAAFHDGRLPTQNRPSEGIATEAGVTSVLSPTQILVETAGRRPAILRTHLLFPGLPANRLVVPGQRFVGRYIEVGLMGEFVPDPVPDDLPARVASFVGDGKVTSLLCSSVDSGSAQFQLHPNVTVVTTAGPDEDLRSFVSEGSVITMEVICVDDELVASFSAEEPTPAMSILTEGPPWIEPEPIVALPSETAIADELLEAFVASDERSRGTRDAPESNHVAELEAQIDSMEKAAEAREATIRELQRELRTTRRLAVPVVFASSDEQFRLEVWLDYLTRVEQASRDRYPWPAQFQVGDRFLETLDLLVRGGGISREKVVEVCADVLCGRARDMPSRAVKEWTASKHGAQLRRGDGAVAFRVRLQTGAASARRLRYFLLPNGEVELDWVGVHDAEI